jgi:hypothetical protein
MPLPSEGNPTGDAGASILDRIESYLSTSDAPPEDDARSQEPPKAQAPEPEAPEVETPASDGEADDAPQVSLSDVARFLGVDESALDVSEEGAVIVKTKVDGKEGIAKFGDLLKSYQLQSHVDAKAREAAEVQKAVQQEREQFEQHKQAETQRISQLAYIAHQELMRDAAGIDWEALARNDPAEYVVKQHEFQARQGRVNQLVQEAQQAQSQFQQAQQMRYTQTLQAEAERLPTLIPEWSDSKVAETEKGELRAWMKSSGFSDQDISSLTRADLVATMRKAMLYDKGKQSASVAEKKVREAPKLVRPGQAVDARQRDESHVRDLKQNIRKSGGRSGIAEYLLATGKV